MIYFDTDVLVHYLIEQNTASSQRAVEAFERTSKNETFFCSLLCLQETAFVLSKLKVSPVDIEEMIESLLTDNPVNYSLSHYKRAIELAKIIGFQNINDCLHTAIAEEFCTEPYTFNKADFKRIQKHTSLKIKIL